MMKRREFIGWASLGCASCSLPAMITACTSQAPKQTASSPDADGFQAVGTVADLDANGQLLVDRLAGNRTALVVRDPAQPEGIVAVNPACPHAGCNVAWQPAETAFICPCHDSKFAADGKVQQGPAEEPLATYMAKIDGDSILIKVSTV